MASANAALPELSVERIKISSEKNKATLVECGLQAIETEDVSELIQAPKARHLAIQV